LERGLCTDLFRSRFATCSIFTHTAVLTICRYGRRNRHRDRDSQWASSTAGATVSFRKGCRHEND
jgi:hypothetical protein